MSTHRTPWETSTWARQEADAPGPARNELREQGYSGHAQRGGVPKDALVGPLGADFDEVLPAREDERKPNEPAIVLRFGTTG